jgi:hypothetical protein
MQADCDGMIMVLQGIMGLYALAINAFRREQDAHTLTVGYSCVVFAWAAYLAASAGASFVVLRE